MSLVDYASSSSSDDEQIEEEEEGNKQDGTLSPPPPPPAAAAQPANPRNQNVRALSDQSAFNTPDISSIPPTSVERLPDVSLLFASPSLSSHQLAGDNRTFRGAATMEESSSRKRESNGSAVPYPQSKYPKGNLRHSRSAPDTMGGLLVPPQVRGRSNVVTEDVNKLFVRRRPDSS